MRMRWRGLELPSRIVRDDALSTDSYGRFVIEPFEQGFGTTIGNSLRRVLLSCLEGAAVTDVRIDGVDHEFTTIEGVLEDVIDIILNVKGIALAQDDAEVKVVSVRRDRAGEIRAGDLETDPATRIANPDHLIATLTADVPFHMQMTVCCGRGYATANENRNAEQEIGVIPVDAIFSPITRVRYRTEAMRVGQKTNYDRLILEIWSKGTVQPEDALVEAGMILRKHLNPLVMYHEIGDAMVHCPPAEPAAAPAVQPAKDSLLDSSVSVLDLSVRAANCLDAAKIATLRELTRCSESELIRFRSFGKTSLHEVQRKLNEIGLCLGMRSDAEGSFPDGEAGSEGVAAGEEHIGGLATAPHDGATSPPGAAPSGPMEVFTMGE